MDQKSNETLFEFMKRISRDHVKKKQYDENIKYCVTTPPEDDCEHKLQLSNHCFECGKDLESK